MLSRLVVNKAKARAEEARGKAARVQAELITALDTAEAASTLSADDARNLSELYEAASAALDDLGGEINRLVLVGGEIAVIGEALVHNYERGANDLVALKERKDAAREAKDNVVPDARQPHGHFQPRLARSQAALPGKVNSPHKKSPSTNPTEPSWTASTGISGAIHSHNESAVIRRRPISVSSVRRLRDRLRRTQPTSRSMSNLSARTE